LAKPGGLGKVGSLPSLPRLAKRWWNRPNQFERIGCDLRKVCSAEATDFSSL